MGRNELGEGEAESAGIRQDGGDEKEGGPAVEPCPGDETSRHDEARDDPDETQHRMEERVRRDAHAEYHGPNVPGVSSCASRLWTADAPGCTSAPPGPALPHGSAARRGWTWSSRSLRGSRRPSWE